METDVVENMEKRRAVREEARKRERLKAEAERKDSAALSKAEQARLVRLERAKRSVSKDVVVVPRFDKAWSSVPLHGGGTSGEGEASAADLWWESTMPKPFDPSTKDTILWKEGDTTPREEARNLVHKYHGKAVPAGYRGLWDDIPEQDRLQQDLDRNQEKFVKSMKVHKYETEAEKKERIRKWEAMSLIEQRKFERAQSSMSQQSAQEEQDREAALDAEEQARLDQLEMQSYEEMMSEYREYEQLKKGRTSYCEGEWICPGNALCATAREAGLPKCSDLCAAATYVAHERARPSPSQDPAAYFKWGERLKKTPTDLRHPDAKFRAKTVMRFADMTEFLKGDEAAMILELGVVEPLLEVWEDSYNETSRDTVWGYLHSSKQGSPEMMERHIHIIGISFCRAMRNLTCALLTDFNLQPVAGKQQPGTIAYTWMDRPATFLEILVRQPGVFDMLCRHLSHDNDECKEHAAYALKNLTHQNDAFKQLIIDAKTINYAHNKETPVLEIMRLNLEHKSFHVQESTGELLSCLFFSDQARAQVLKHRGVKGVSMLPTVCRLMTHGSDHSQAIAARIVWDMCVKCRRDWKAQQRSGQKPKSLAAVKRSVGGKTTIEEANNLLGDGSMADFVKQDLCREPGLIKGLTHLLNLGASEARESAAGALWALCVERGNKRFLAQDRQLLQAISATINDVDASDKTVRYAAAALRNLATDLWVMDCMAAADKDLIRVLLRHCDIHDWQHAIVAPAQDAQ